MSAESRALALRMYVYYGGDPAVFEQELANAEGQK